MSKISLEIDTKEFEKMIDNLPLPEKIKLTKRLERQTLGKMLNGVFGKIDQRRNKFPISDKEIKKEIAAVREEIYGKSGS